MDRCELYKARFLNEHKLVLGLPMQGKVLDHQSVYADAHQPSTITLDRINNLPQGLYFVTIEKDGKRATQKLIRL